jgi:hypothetical protein
MGLGKTLSTLALICLSLDYDTSNEDASHPNLVVTTKSSKFSYLQNQYRLLKYRQLYQVGSCR